jgi:pimeloyl-ACP methyl ester carboxylesterase
VPFADIPGARLYYEVHGEGTPLLLHPGFGCTVEVYWANTGPLAQHFQVIVFDPRGAGRSSTGDAAATTAKTYADDAAALLDVLGVAQAHVVGMSFGGMMAQHIALEHPRRVRRLVLACTTAGGAGHVPPPEANMAKFMAASEITDPAAAVRSTYFLNYSDAYVGEHDAEIVARALRNQGLRSNPAGLAVQMAAVQSHDTIGRLGEIAAPTLVLHGTDDGTVPVENGRALAAAIPGARLIEYPGGRHLFFVECAERMNADIVAFLRADGRDGAAK